MEDKEKLSFKKNINKMNKYEKYSYILKRQSRNTTINVKIYIIFKFFILILFIIIFLFLEKKGLLNKLNKLQYDYINNYNLTNIMDYREKQSNIVKKLLGYKIEKYENNNLNQIHISYSLDNNIIYPTLVSMISGLENNKKIVYHLLLSHDFNLSNIQIFESLKLNYTVMINYYIIPNIFSHLKKWTEKTSCIYYNAGCLLFNIDKITKDDKDVDLILFTIKNSNDLIYPEQDSINIIFYPYIGFLPLKYGIYMIGTNKRFKLLSQLSLSTFNLTEAYEAIADPAIVHFSYCWPKLWTKGTKNVFKENEICERYQKEFYFYAKKTGYYSFIYTSLFFPK